MTNLNVLSAETAMDILRQLSTGEARFRNLNEVVKNTRTLTRRLKELQTADLIQKSGMSYRITNEGFNLFIKVVDMEHPLKLRWANEEGFTKIKYEWMKVSFKRLIKLFFEEFSEELISVVLYGSLARDIFKLGESDVDLFYILGDAVEDAWRREQDVFRRFKSTLEYRACDYWLRMREFYGYPEVAVAMLRKSHAKIFQPIYLDMLTYRMVLYDKESFFEQLVGKLREALKVLGTIRIEYADGTWSWVLKPNMAPGELISIKLE